MALPKFEDWKRPWKEEEFDAEKAAKLIYNLHKDKETLAEAKTTLTAERDALQTKVTEFEDKDLSEVEKLRKENERLKNGTGPKPEPKAPTADGDDLEKARLEIALEKGLTLKEAKRLAGSTREELESDADDYLEETGRGATGGEDGSKSGGKEGQAPPSIRAQVTPKTGSKQKNEPVDPDADLDPGALFDKVMGKV